MYELTIEPTEDVVEVDEGQTVLDACLRAGVWLPHACGHGLCGTCKVEVLDGDVEHGPASPFALMDFEREEGFTLACSATLRADTTVEADIDEDPDAVVRPVQDFVGRVSRLERLTSDILGVWLAVDGIDGKGVAFQAGQYLNLTVDGVDEPRAFSFANSPSQADEVELHIRLVPGGAATTIIHEQLAVGDELRFAGPYGRFHVRRSAAKPLLFLTGGSGLSSPKSMVLDLLESGYEQPITLIHGVRTAADLYFDELFTDLEASHPTFTYLPAPQRARPGRRRLGGGDRVRERGGRAPVRGFVQGPVGLSLRPASHDRGLHPLIDEGPPVRARYLHREVRDRGRRGGRPGP